MFVQIQETPNPNTLKFIPGVDVIKSGNTYQFTQNDNCEESPLAKKLLQVCGTEQVFFGRDFISVTKDGTTNWSEIKTFIMSTIIDYFIADIPVVNEKNVSDQKKVEHKNDKSDYSKIEEQIIELINIKIRPAVAQDGGDIIYNKFERGIVYLELRGACQGCPSSSITLKQGIENMLKHYVPEVQSVVSI